MANLSEVGDFGEARKKVKLVTPGPDADDAALQGSAGSGTFRRVLQNAGWMLAGKGVGAVLSLIYLAIATRSLGLTDFGQLALILGTAQTIAALVGFQTWQIVIRFGMPHLQSGRQDKLRDLVGVCLLLDFGGALIGCVLALLSVRLLGAYFGWSETLQDQALVFAIVMLLSIRSTAVGVLRLHDKFRTGALGDSIIPVVRLIGAVIALFSGATIAGFLLAWAAAELSAAIVFWWLAARTAGKAMSLRRLPNPVAALRDNPGLGHFTFVTNVNLTLAGFTKQFSTVIVGFFAGAAAAGQFRLAHQLGQSLAKVAELMSRAVYSELTRVHFGAAREDLVKLFRSSVRFSMLAAAAIVLLLLLLGKPALLLVAGAEFAGAYPLLLLLGVAAALDLGGVSFAPALLATGRAGQALTLRLASTAVLIAFMAVLLPTMEAIGAGIAILAASLVGLFLFGWAAWRGIHQSQ